MIVYQLKNKQNNKCYYGYTSQTLEIRWNEHINSAKAGSPFHIHNAIRKYGEDAFERTIYKECKTESEAQELEALLIYLYNSNDRKHGYNITSGGSDHRDDSPPKVKLREETKKKYNLY